MSQDVFIRSLVGIMVYMLLQKIKTVNHWIICFIMGGGGDPVENEYGITGDLAAVDDRFDEEQGNLIFRTLVDGKIDTYPWELEQKGGDEQ